MHLFYYFTSSELNSTRKSGDMYTVSSEIYEETDYQQVKLEDGKVISKFQFQYPNDDDEGDDDDEHDIKNDKDGDLIVKRRPRKGIIELEHSASTELKYVGLQVWRGALLLADFLISRRKEIAKQQILELGAGVGLASIVAGIYAPKVVCTDVDLGGILNLIKSNMQRNAVLINGQIEVLEFDFLQSAATYAPPLVEAIKQSQIIVAADVIYDDVLTNAFIKVIEYIFSCEQDHVKTIYIALEKRYVFTLSELDAVAPMYEYFLKQTMNKPWHLKNVPLDFPQYMTYERCKQLVLLEVTSGKASV